MSLKSKTVAKQMSLVAPGVPQDLGDGLVLRLARPEDSEPLAQFNGRIHGVERFDEMAAAWTRDYISESHPTCGPSNVFIVEETRSGKIVSTMCLIPQTWTLDGISIQVGRPEAVGTDPEYRRRGLVRALFEAAHAKSAAMGHAIQVITGIYWFYRQFGYDYALDLGGGRTVPLAFVPSLPDGQAERYRLRPMKGEDVPWVGALYDRATRRSLVACPRPDWLWQHLLTGYSRDSSEAFPFRVVETEAGRPVGYLAPIRELNGKWFPITELEFAEGESVRAIMPSVLRGLKEMARAEAALQSKEIDSLFFQLGREHPVFEASPEIFVRTRAPYGWYIRVADMPSLLRQIAPALETRLAESPLAGHSGVLKIDEFVRGTLLEFERGRLVRIEPWQNPAKSESQASFPPYTFVQLVFGFRSLADLRANYPDCFAQEEATVLLNILFPRHASKVSPIG